MLLSTAQSVNITQNLLSGRAVDVTQPNLIMQCSAQDVLKLLTQKAQLTHD
jgi:hypothetical protein